jgi:AcrR family transcriptional regulator
MTVIAPSTKEQIVLAAEGLFAERGNNSAVQYHFGTKERLVQAVFEYRLPRLRERRDLLLAERRPDDLRAWVECEARWMFEQSELDDSNYMSFVSMLTQYGRTDVFDQLPDDLVTSTRAYHAHINSLLSHLDEPLRSHRVRRAMASLVHAAADRERARGRGLPVLPFAVALGDTVDGIVGYLEAPASAETLAALERS